MGLEPTTPCLQSRCSSQLSYVPEFFVSCPSLPPTLWEPSGPPAVRHRASTLQSGECRIFDRVSNWSDPPELHRHQAYDGADVEALVQHITARVVELERQVSELRQSGGARADLKLGQAVTALAEAARQERTRLAEAERRAQARLTEADRYFSTRLVEADLQAQTILEEARREGLALVEAVRRSLEDAVRLKDEEVLAALGGSHDRVLALLDEKVRQRDGRGHQPQYRPLPGQ
jgi:hypothetical protein